MILLLKKDNFESIFIYYIHFKITIDPCNLIGLHWCSLFTNCDIFFALNCIFFLANRKAILNHLTTTNQITWKLVKAFATFKNLELSTGSIKYLYRLKILYPTDCRVLWPQNGCDKVVIGLHAKQLWSKIILVITNQTCASVFRFEITHMISDQIAQNEVQLNHY